MKVNVSLFRCGRNWVASATHDGDFLAEVESHDPARAILAVREAINVLGPVWACRSICVNRESPGKGKRGARGTDV